jgi:hypothetical protein
MAMISLNTHRDGFENLVLRRVSGSGRDFPKDCERVAVGYLNQANKVIIKNQYAANAIIGFDETSIYVDMPENYTYDVKGATKVKAASCGQDRVRLSCVMTATLNGTKLPLLIAIPRDPKKRLPELDQIPGLVVMYEPSGELICILIYI